jgi:hypothetical protein
MSSARRQIRRKKALPVPNSRDFTAALTISTSPPRWSRIVFKNSRRVIGRWPDRARRLGVGGLCGGDRRLTPQKRLIALTFAADFGEAFKPTDPISRIGGDAVRVEVLSEFLTGHRSSGMASMDSPSPGEVWGWDR